MHPTDEEVIQQIDQWLQGDRACWLATVIGTWGSSPRPIGSLLGCDTGGHIVGSLSGGCVEDDLLEKLTRGELARDEAQFFEYGVTAEESEKFGLPCGGSLLIVIEPLKPDADTKAHFRHIAERLEARGRLRRIVDVGAGLRRLEDVDGYEPLRWDAERQVLTHSYGPRLQLFIIGAGMVSKYVAEMAKSLDYAVTVCDPRQQLLDDFGVAGVELVCDMPDDAIRARASDAATAIVALTHDPRIDDMGLLEALRTEAFYVGAMGSSRTSASRRERLEALELTTEEINRLHAPIGLPIGSKTPPEIAISILAEITQVRARLRAEQRDAAAAQGASC
jgi:xanthine dehydrogenase accessory factor